MEAYTAAGFDPGAFWALSPRLYQAHMNAAAKRAERDQNMAMMQAYLTAGLMRAKRMPRFETLIKRRLPKHRRQSREVLQAMCDALAAAWGAKPKE
jgi:hypothetical protein